MKNKSQMMFKDLFKKIIRRYDRYTSKGAVFAERFNRTIKDLLRKPVFEKSFANWLNWKNVIKKEHDITKHSTTKFKPIQTIFIAEWKIWIPKNIRQKQEIEWTFKLGDLLGLQTRKSVLLKKYNKMGR